MTNVVEEQGGSVRNFTGDGVMALFGVPRCARRRTTQSLPCRASPFTIASQAPQARLPRHTAFWPTAVRIGINTGPVVVGKVRAAIAARLRLWVDTVNLRPACKRWLSLNVSYSASDPSTGAGGLTETEPGRASTTSRASLSGRCLSSSSTTQGCISFRCGPQPRAHGYVGRSLEPRNVGPLLAARAARVCESSTSSVNPASASPGCYMSFAADSVIGRYSCWRGAARRMANRHPSPIYRGRPRFVSSQNRRGRIRRSSETGQGPRDSRPGVATEFGTAAQFAGINPPPGTLQGLDRHADWPADP